MLTPLKKNPLAHTLLVLLFFTAVFVVFFAPVLASGRLLAPGDGTVQSLPNFYGPRTLWDEMIWGGFPAVADSQTMRWYPLTFLFSGLLGSWNVFVIVAYVLASCFAYGYAYTLTRSRLAALVSGIVYGMSGFLLVHLCHVVIIHAMAWLPLLLWSLENLRRRFNAGWFVAGCLAVAGSLLSGHPQIPAYTLCLAAAYVLVRGRRALVGRWRFYGLSALLAVLGLGLAAIQLIPTAELAGLSLRASLDFEAFVAYELPPRQLPMLLFPYLFGGSPGSLYGVPYFGAWGSGIVDTWGPTELSGYIGLLPPMLAAVGFTVYRRQPIPIFWLVVGVLSLLLALGSATPLAALVYHLPVLNKFRAPARHFAEMSLAVSVLAGYGALAITRELARRRLINRVVIAGAGLMLACLAWVLFSADQLKALAAAKGVVRLSLWPWVNPAVGVPLLVFAAAAAALLYWHRRPGSAPRRAVLVVVLVLDLASFGWFCEWRFLSPDKSMTETPDFASGYKDALAQTHQRLLPVRGALGRRGEFPPNVSKLWGLASAGGYGPLMLSRVSRALSMVAYGAVDGSWQDDANRSL
ncbi:MAG: YfhO family protein, partial [Pyrinomonadaceae bacterium]